MEWFGDSSLLSRAVAAKPLLVDDYRDSTTQYIGDYNNPIGNPFLNQPLFHGMMLRDFEHCSVINHCGYPLIPKAAVITGFRHQTLRGTGLCIASHTP